jgi:hypothetical protein
MSQTLRRQNTHLSQSTRSSTSRRSDDSQDSRSTAPTSVGYSPRPSTHHAYTEQPVYSKRDYEFSPTATYIARSSVETYASGASEEDLFLEPESYEEEYDAEYEVPEYLEVVETDLKPTNPSNFADYFPSTKRLFIRHDDTTYDGNMNLRVDTEGSSKKKGNVQLFHLRMQDLKKREFSLRRYERSSGREVCHSARKYEKLSEQRPALTRSVSHAIAGFRKPEFKRTGSMLSQHSQKSTKGIKRSDSGYGSIHENTTEVTDFMAELKAKSPSLPTNTTKLEFSNYAQVDVKRRGKKSSKRYEFEYWGYTYKWKRVEEKYSGGKSVSYHLHKGEGPAIAHIVPELRSPAQMHAERAAGGWVPPCSMWISDPSVVEALTDVAE